MKKSRSLFIALLLSLSAIAQDHPLEIGLEAGPSFAWLSGNSGLKQFRTPRPLIEGGLAIQFNFNNTFALRAVPCFGRKGSVVKMQLTDATGVPTGSINLYNHFDYLTLPLLFRASFGSDMKIFGNVGPYVAYLLQANTSYSAIKASPVFPTNKDTFKPFDFGVSVGAGVLIPLKSRCSFTVEMRNNLGLFNISKVAVVDDGSIKNNSACVLFGFSLRV